MFGTVVEYHYLKVDKNESKTNECVYDYLLKNYKIKGLTKENLMDLFGEESTIKVFHHYLPKKRSHHLPVLIYVTANQHLYPISNQTLRQSIVAIQRAKSTGGSNASTKKDSYSKYNNELPVVLNPRYKEISYLENTNVIFTNQDSLLDLVLYFFKHEKAIYKVESHQSRIKRIQYKNGVDIQINPDFYEAKRDCEKLCIPFRNQSLIQLANEAFDIYKEDDEIKTVFNSQTRELFFKNTKIARDYTYYEPQMNAKLTAIDIQKCYTAAATIKNEYPFPVYNPFDEVKPYVPSENELKNGYYIVETDDFEVMRGDGLYSRAVLEYCKSVKIEYKIKYEVIPSNYLPKDYFNDFVRRIYNNCSNPKLMLNAIIGCFNKKSRTNQKDTFTVDRNDAIRAYHESENCKFDKHGDLYHIKQKTEAELFGNCVPIYYQILDNASIEVHKLRVKMGGRVVRVKTDCLVVGDANNVECLPGIGNYREECLSKFESFTKSPIQISKFQYKHEIHEWKSIENHKSRMLTGLAGSGKSTALKNDMEELENYAVLATTNKAARLIGGETIHSFFAVDIHNKYNENFIIQKAAKYSYIILDEVSMLPNKLYELLLPIKTKTKSKLIICGDYRQLKGVKQVKYDYLNSLLLKELVDFNLEVLQGNKRSGDDMSEMYNRIPELKASNFGNEFTTRHVSINEIMMERDKKLKKSKTLPIEANKYDPNSQKVTLLKGSPVIAIRTDKRKGFVNGDAFKVVNLEPLTIKDGKRKLVIDKINVHKLQGDSISIPFTIHEFSRMDDEMKYVSISRATSKELINIIEDDSKYPFTPDTNHDRLMRNKQEEERLKDPLYVRRRDALAVVSKIIKDKNTNDEYCLEHTGLKRLEFLKHLKVEDGRVPKGMEVDHIKPRCEHHTDEDIKMINHYSNLRLLSKRDNIARNSQK